MFRYFFSHTFLDIDTCNKKISLNFPTIVSQSFFSWPLHNWNLMCCTWNFFSHLWHETMWKLLPHKFTCLGLIRNLFMFNVRIIDISPHCHILILKRNRFYCILMQGFIAFAMNFNTYHKLKYLLVHVLDKL